MRAMGLVWAGFCIFACGGVYGACRELADVTFADAVAQVRENQSAKAKLTLEQLSEEAIVAQGLAYLNSRSGLDDRELEFCFRALVEHGAGKTESGSDLFAGYIDTPSVRNLVTLGLADAPPSRRDKAIAILTQTLSGEIDGIDFVGVVRRIGDWGEDEKKAFDFITRVFEDSRVESRARAVAAEEMLSTGSIARAIEHFEGQNRILALGALASAGGNTRGQFDGMDSTKERVRAYVREGMRVDDKDTRELAFYSLPMVYGLDALLGTATEGYRFEPAFLEALESMARVDPDDELRSKAQKWIDTKDQRMQAAIRRRANPDKYKRE